MKHEADNKDNKQLDNDQLEKLLLDMEAESKKNIKNEDSSKTVKEEECKIGQQHVKHEVNDDQLNDVSKIEAVKTDQSEGISKIETMNTNQSDNRAENSNQSGESENINDQSEADTETADEEVVSDIEKEVYFTEQRDLISLCRFGELPKLSIEGLSPSEIISRFELLLEVERIEREVENKVAELNGYLDGKLNFNISSNFLSSFKVPFS